MYGEVIEYWCGGIYFGFGREDVSGPTKLTLQHTS